MGTELTHSVEVVRRLKHLLLIDLNDFANWWEERLPGTLVNQVAVSSVVSGVLLLLSIRSLQVVLVVLELTFLGEHV